MDYFKDLLSTFLSIGYVSILAVYGRHRELLEHNNNLLISVPQMNEGLTDLE